MALTLNEVFSVKELGDRVPFSLTSDGRWLAYTVKGKRSNLIIDGVPDSMSGNELWVYDMEKKQNFAIISEAAVSSWGGVWSPDGSKLAFYSDLGGKAQLWIWDSIQASLQLASDITVRPFFGFDVPIWSRDGKSLIVKAMVSDYSQDFEREHYSERNESERIQVFSTRHEVGENGKGNMQTWINRYRADIIRIDIFKGETQVLASGIRPVGIKLSNDGSTIAFTEALGQVASDSQQVSYDLWVAPVFPQANESEQCIEKNVQMAYGTTFSWSKDDRSIFYTTSGQLSDGNLWIVNLEDGAIPKFIESSIDVNFGREYDGPLTLENNDALLISDGKLWRYQDTDGEIMQLAQNLERDIVAVVPSVFLETTEGGGPYVILQTMNSEEFAYGFWKLNIEINKLEKLFEEPRGHLPWFEGGVTFTPNGSKIVYLAQSADEPPSIWCYDFIKFEKETVVHLSKIRKELLGQAMLLNWKRGSNHYQGALLLPPNLKNRAPVIVRVYGGAMLSKSIRFFGLSPWAAENHHLFASRGYAVFMPDLPINSNEPADDIVKGLEIALEALCSRPEIDSNRIGIIGHSFGGYSALAAITRVHKFRAAVVSAAMANLISFATKFDPAAPDFFFGWAEGGQARMGSTLWEDTQRYIRNSPLFQFDQIETPLLIAQGTRDHLCNDEAGPMYSSLRRLKKEVELVLYDEDHFQGTWLRENLNDYYCRVFEWFERYL